MLENLSDQSTARVALKVKPRTVLLGMAHPRGNMDPAGMMKPSALDLSLTLSIVMIGPLNKLRDS